MFAESSETFLECKSDGHSTLECAAHVAISQTSLVSSVNRINDCVLDGCTPLACTAQEAASSAITSLTIAVGGSLIAASIPLSLTPARPLAPVAFGVGVSTIMSADAIGKTAGDLTMDLFEYLVDNVPYDAIDVNGPIVISNVDETVYVKFQPAELKFIQQLVQSNQHASMLSNTGRDSADRFTDSFASFEHKFHANHGVYSESSNIIRMEIATVSSLYERLRASMPRVNLDEVKRDVSTEFVDIHTQAVAHNSQPDRNTNASVSYDSGSKKFSIQFTYNVGYGCNGGKRSGGGCSIL